jgi:PAS domain S-box-containing protein
METMSASLDPRRADDEPVPTPSSTEEQLLFARAALDSLLDPCVILAPVRAGDGCIVDFVWVDANRAACDYNGIPYGDLMGQRLLDRLPAHIESGVFAEYVQVVETGLPVSKQDFAFSGPDRNGPFRRFDLHASRAMGHLVLSWRDSTLLHEQETYVAESDRRFRLLAENSSDIVYEMTADGTIVWVSPSVYHVLGWRPEQWLGRLTSQLVAKEDLPHALDLREDVLERGVSLDCRFFTADGERNWMSVRGRRITDSEGEVRGLVIGLRDVQDEVVARRAATTLSAGNAILVRAEREEQLLSEMCEMAVADAGYLFAWYGRPIHDADQSVVPVASAVQRRSYLDAVHVSWGDGPNGLGPSGTCIRTGQPAVVHDFLLEHAYQPWMVAATAHGFRSSLSLPVFVDGSVDGALMVYASEVHAFDVEATKVLRDLAAQLGFGLSRLRDAERLSSALAEQLLLSTAIDQAAEAVVVTDTTPSIRYANPAALRSSGYALEEVIGKNPSMFQSGLHDEEFYQQMWARLAGGKTWRGVMMNRRKSGEFYEEETSITPVHDDHGHRIAFVGVKHDLSRVRSLEAVVNRDQLDRDSFMEVMRDLRASDTLSATAASLCSAVRRFDDIDGAMVIAAMNGGSAVPIAVDGPLPQGQAIGTPIEMNKLDVLMEVSRAGPWWMDFRDLEGLAGLDPQFAAMMTDIGFTAAAYAPIRWEGEMLGVLSVATKSAAAADWMPLRLGVLAEVGSFAGMLLGPQAKQHGRRQALRTEIADIIDRSAFHTVFESVVDLTTGTPIGYEALTRFDDHVAPDRRFSDATLVGLGSELEAACARAALVASSALPGGAWVSVNFSPSALVEGKACEVLQGMTRPVVIEITEHIEIENYAAVRRAVGLCGGVRVAVDDAGAGFASLRHILELQPDIIKLDIALVRGIDTDPARQALAAGLRHFAALTGTTLIAEGVETDAEAMTIRELGVDLAQGFLFDQPR